MKYDDQYKSYSQQRWHQPYDRNRDENWGANFGDNARPYGEDYGEDYGDDNAEPSRSRDRNTRSNRNEDIGFSYGSPRRRGQRSDYGRSQVEGHSRGSGIDMGARFNRGYARHGSNLMRERGYMSGDDYDRGSPRYEQNTAFDRISDQPDFGDRRESGTRRRNEDDRQSHMGWREADYDRDRQISLEDEENFRGHTSEDYPGYREMYERSEYPETYRSAMSGYISEHVGHDRGRKDYFQTGKEGNMYGSQFGLHKGKGPKNYKRSDDRIKEEINDRLTDDPWVDAIEIETEVKNGEVILSGTVNGKSEKRRAEDIADSVSGVANVENRLRLETAESSSSGQRW